MRLIRPVALILLALVATRASAQTTKPASPSPAKPAAKSPKAAADILPFKATQKTLPNGLKLIVVPTGFPNIVSLQIPVQTGSRNEVEPGKSGFAHFFEHMMFRGTEGIPAGAVPGDRDHAGRPAERVHDATTTRTTTRRSRRKTSRRC